MITNTTIDTFKKITGYNVSLLLAQFAVFIENDFPNIQAYYSGSLKTPNSQSFKNLDYLLEQYTLAINLANLGKNSFKNVDSWELMTSLEEAQNKLLLISNISKFLRSSIPKGIYNTGTVVDYNLRYAETLEKATLNLGSPDHQNEWSEVALNNDLIEEDYTPEGGVLLKVVFRHVNTTTDINSVVDNIYGERLYGLDINRKLTFEDDDLATLSYKDTVKQAIEIMSNIRQGDIPEFPTDGIQSQFVVGTSVGAVSFPALFRQLTNVFAKDDTVSGFSVKDLKKDQDAIYVLFEINTKLNETIIQKVKI